MEDLRHLIDRISDRDENALDELYRLSAGAVFGTVARILNNRPNAEEATQDVYWQIWSQAKTYRPDKGTPAAWITMIAKSRAIDSTRRGRRDTRNCPLEENIIQPIKWDPDRQHDLASRRRKIQAALGGLRQDQRRLVEMSFYEGYTHPEIADITGIPLGTVKTRLRTALRALRETLQGLPNAAYATSLEQ